MQEEEEATNNKEQLLIDKKTRKVMKTNRSCTQDVILQEYIYQGIKGKEDSLAAKLVSVGKKTI